MKIERLSSAGCTRFTVDGNRELTVSGNEDHGINVAVVLYREPGPTAAGLNLTIEGAGELIAALARCIAAASSTTQQSPEEGT